MAHQVTKFYENQFYYFHDKSWQTSVDGDLFTRFVIAEPNIQNELGSKDSTSYIVREYKHKKYYFDPKRLIAGCWVGINSQGRRSNIATEDVQRALGKPKSYKIESPKVDEVKAVNASVKAPTVDSPIKIISRQEKASKSKEEKFEQAQTIKNIGLKDLANKNLIDSEKIKKDTISGDTSKVFSDKLESFRERAKETIDPLNTNKETEPKLSVSDGIKDDIRNLNEDETVLQGGSLSKLEKAKDVSNEILNKILSVLSQWKTADEKVVMDEKNAEISKEFDVKDEGKTTELTKVNDDEQESLLSKILKGALLAGAIGLVFDNLMNNGTFTKWFKDILGGLVDKGKELVKEGIKQVNEAATGVAKKVGENVGTLEEKLTGHNTRIAPDRPVDLTDPSWYGYSIKHGVEHAGRIVKQQHEDLRKYAGTETPKIKQLDQKVFIAGEQLKAIEIAKTEHKNDPPRLKQLEERKAIVESDIEKYNKQIRELQQTRKEGKAPEQKHNIEVYKEAKRKKELERGPENKDHPVTKETMSIVNEKKESNIDTTLGLIKGTDENSKMFPELPKPTKDETKPLPGPELPTNEVLNKEIKDKEVQWKEIPKDNNETKPLSEAEVKLDKQADEITNPNNPKYIDPKKTFDPMMAPEWKIERGEVRPKAPQELTKPEWKIERGSVNPAPVIINNNSSETIQDNQPPVEDPNILNVRNYEGMYLSVLKDVFSKSII